MQYMKLVVETKSLMLLWIINKPYKINLFQEEHIVVTHKKISEILTNWKLENEIIRDVFYESGEKNDNVFYV